MESFETFPTADQPPERAYQKYLEEIGNEKPTGLSLEEFERRAWLYHASSSESFSVTPDFDYSSEIVDGTTLGHGLYTTTNKEQAERYAKLRNGSVHKLMPYQASMLNLTSAERLSNISVPQELVTEWVEFARPLILQRALDPKTHPLVQQCVIELLGSMPELASKSFVDLRVDILGTPNWRPSSPVEDIWRQFCANHAIDGIITVECIEDESRTADKTYMFYSLDKVGTYRDWQARSAVE